MSHSGSEGQPQAHWLNSLSLADRQAAITMMKVLSKKWDIWNAVYDKLKPPPGTIPVGGQHIDAFAKSEAIWEFNSAIGKGLTPKEARESAYRLAKKILESWNRSRKDYQVHRWVHAEESFIFGATLDMVKLADRIAGPESAGSVA